MEETILYNTMNNTFEVLNMVSRLGCCTYVWAFEFSEVFAKFNFYFSAECNGVHHTSFWPRKVIYIEIYNIQETIQFSRLLMSQFGLILPKKLCLASQNNKYFIFIFLNHFSTCDHLYNNLYIRTYTS